MVRFETVSVGEGFLETFFGASGARPVFFSQISSGEKSPKPTTREREASE
jgi:hypothetical protein